MRISRGTPTRPTCPPLRARCSRRAPERFVAKVNAAGAALAYLTYLGPGYQPLSPNTNPANTVTGIAADAAGNAYVTGSTFDDAFPATPGAWQTVRKGETDAFAGKLNPQGSAMVWATYLGGKGADSAHAIALDGERERLAQRDDRIAGLSESDRLVARQRFRDRTECPGSTLIYSSRLPDDTAAASVAVDGAGALHLAGYDGLVSTLTTAQGGCGCARIFGIANAAFGPVGGRVSPGEVISIYGPRLGPSTPVTGGSRCVRHDAEIAGRRTGIGQWLAGPAAVCLGYADQRGDAALPFGRHGARACEFNSVDTSDFVATIVEAIPEVFQRPDGTRGGGQPGWHHQFAGASGAGG